MSYEPNKNSNALNWILGASLVLIGIFVSVSLVLIKTQADDISGSVGINNSAPTIGSVLVDTQTDPTVSGVTTAAPLTLASNQTTDLFVKFPATDLNGNADTNGGSALKSVAIYTLGGTDATKVSSGGNCTADNDRNCQYYSWNDDATIATETNNHCQVMSVDSTTQTTYQCQFNVPSYADGTDGTARTDATASWKAAVSVTDRSSANAVAGSLFDVAGCFSASLSDNTLNFGSINAGGSATDSVTASQKCNMRGSSTLLGAPLACDVTGSIPAADLRYAPDTAPATPAAGTALSDSIAQDTGITVGYETGATPWTQNVGFRVDPPIDVAGTCSGTFTWTFSAL